MGNGNGGTAGTTGLMFTTNNAASDPIVKNFRPWSIKAGANNQCTYSIVAGIVDVEWVMTTTAYQNATAGDSIGQNGMFGNMQPLCGGTSAAGQTTGVFQIGGAAAGSGYASTSYFTGTIIEMAFYGSLLTQAQAAQAHNFLLADAVSRGFVPTMQPTISGGVNPAFFPSDTGNSCVFLGDSLTSGSGFTPWSTLLTLNQPCTNEVSSARSGDTSIQMVPDFQLAVAPAFRPGGQINWASNWDGTNDGNPAQAWGQNRSFITQARAVGFLPLVSTMISRSSGQDANKDTLNALILLNAPALGAAVVHLAGDPNIGADGASANASFFQGDGVHVLTATSYNDVTPMYNISINRLTGNRDFNDAKTYTTASGGAIALSAAATESTNTMSFPSAGWTANQFVVGTRMHCTGISVAGYNDVYPGWLIISNTGTVITAYNNTTGLGNSTVAGTCVGSVQQDADQYQILNGTFTAAAPYTLESALGLGGINQNIYLWNKAAIPAYVAPWTAGTGPTTETINGQSALVIGPGQVTCLAAIPGANTTGGVTWQTCQTANAPMTAFVTGSDYTNAGGAGAFSNVTGLSFPVVASVKYHMHCNLVWNASAVTTGPEYQITGPAAPTSVVITTNIAVTSATSASAAATAFSSALNPVGITVTSGVNEFSQLDMDLVNGTTAGVVQIQASGQGVGTLTIRQGSGCQLQAQ